MDSKNLRYIVMMLNTEAPQYTSSGQLIDQHDGVIFTSRKEAREYAIDAIEEKLCTRFSIGVFCLDTQAQRMNITELETFGFKKDKKSVRQMSIFA